MKLSPTIIALREIAQQPEVKAMTPKERMWARYCGGKYKDLRRRLREKAEKRGEMK